MDCGTPKPNPIFIVNKNDSLIDEQQRADYYAKPVRLFSLFKQVVDVVFSD